MPRRFLPALLVLAALLADTSGSHGLALAFLLLGIPAGFMLALDCYGDALEAHCSGWLPVLRRPLPVPARAERRAPQPGGGRRRARAAVSALVLALLLYGAVAIRAFLPGPRTVPESA